MRRIFLITFGLLWAITLIFWGFPGIWGLMAAAPAFIAAGTLHHILMRLRPNDDAGAIPGFRPAFVVLGGVFTIILGAIALTFMWAATASPDVEITAERLIPAPQERVWQRIADIDNRPSWSDWIADVEPIGRGGPAQEGSRYRATIALERSTRPAEILILTFDEEKHFHWQIDFQGGSLLNDITESLRLEAESDVLTRVRYVFAYHSPTVMARVLDRMGVRGSVSRLAESSLERLDRLATDHSLND